MHRSSVFKAPQLKARVDGGFVLLLSLLLFFDEGGVLAAAVPAVSVHELCHAAAMRLYGAYPTRLHASLSGFALDYAGSVSRRALALTALAGPLGGLLFALLCALSGRALNSEYLYVCAGLGVVLNLFNLLPALPLDGGVLLQSILESCLGAPRSRQTLCILGFAVSAALLLCGLYFLHAGQGAALLMSGLWLAVLQRKHTCK